MALFYLTHPFGGLWGSLTAGKTFGDDNGRITRLSRFGKVSVCAVRGTTKNGLVQWGPFVQAGPLPTSGTLPPEWMDLVAGNTNEEVLLSDGENGWIAAGTSVRALGAIAPRVDPVQSLAVFGGKNVFIAEPATSRVFAGTLDRLASTSLSRDDFAARELGAVLSMAPAPHRDDAIVLCENGAALVTSKGIAGTIAMSPTPGSIAAAHVGDRVHLAILPNWQVVLVTTTRLYYYAES